MIYPCDRIEDNRDRRWVVGFAALVLFITTLPYLIGYASQGEDWRFTGFILNVEDGNSYIGKMYRGSVGDWLFRTPYSALPQKGVLAFLPYLLLGKLASPPGIHEQLVALYHLFRIFAGILMVLATYDFLSLFITGKWERRLATVLATIGGGLGWVLITSGIPSWLGSIPLEFYSPETFGFLSLYSLPHLALARACLLWGLTRILVSRGKTLDRRELFRQGLSTGGIWLVGGLAQPLVLVIGFAVIAGYLFVTGVREWIVKHSPSHQDKSLWMGQAKFAFLAVIVPSPLLIYDYLVLKTDPFVQVWTSQNLILSPHPLHYALAFGVWVPFAFIGISKLIRDNERVRNGWFLATWLFLLPIFAYFPFNLQRRLPDGIWVALVASAMCGIEWIGSIGNRWRAFAVVLTSLTIPSTLFLIAGGIDSAVRPATPVFRPVGEIASFSYLANEAAPDSVVLSSFETGNALPAWAAVQVVIGHGPETIYLEKIEKEVAAFYSQVECDVSCVSFLIENSIDYVFWGPAERALGSGDPGEMTNLNLVFEEGEYRVYQVIAETKY